MAKAIHTMIRVLDLDKSMDFYKRAFGLDLAQRFDFDDFTLAYLRNDEASSRSSSPGTTARRRPTPTAAAMAMWRYPSTTAKRSTTAWWRRGSTRTR